MTAAAADKNQEKPIMTHSSNKTKNLLKLRDNRMKISSYIVYNNRLICKYVI